MARTNLALLYRKIGLFDKALENFEALLQYWKDSPQPYIFLVETYFGLRQIERAKYWLSLGLKNFPEDKKLREIKRFLEKTKGEAWKPLP